MSARAAPLVMLVDDTPANLKLLDTVLRERGCDVCSFTSGALALASASARAPDLILLDIAMPELDGFEVCRRLKADPGVAGVPVIFLTAHGAPAEKLKAFTAGGVDYVTKPFHVEELWARVSAHLRLRSMTVELEAHNRALDTLVAERSAALADAHRRLGVLDQAKSDFLRLMSHELRTPLNGLFGVGELLIDEAPPSESVSELAQMFRASQERLMSLLESAELLTRIQVGLDGASVRPVPLAPLLRAAVEALGVEAARRVVVVDGPEDALVMGEPELLRHALRAILRTALRFAHVGLRVSWAPSAGGVTVRAEATGAVVPPAVLPHFFNVMGAARNLVAGGELGLDPSVSERVFSLFGGALTVENLDPPGMCLTAALIAPQAR